MEPLLKLLSGLLSFSLEREPLVERPHAANNVLANLALTDALTGLFNRRAVLGELPRMLALAAREKAYVLVGAVDLDGFKAISDNHGHQAGDRFLKDVATRMKAALRTADVIGRTGGGEFIVAALGPLSEQRDQPGEMLNAVQALQQRIAGCERGGSWR